MLNLEKYVKLAPWLQFVGYMLAFAGLIWRSHALGPAVGYFGLGVSIAGYLYHKIYP